MLSKISEFLKNKNRIDSTCLSYGKGSTSLSSLLMVQKINLGEGLHERHFVVDLFVS